jgi:hypothetical protein
LLAHARQQPRQATLLPLIIGFARHAQQPGCLRRRDLPAHFRRPRPLTGTVDLTATGGKTGNLLLDPATLEVVTSGSGTVSAGQNDPTSTMIAPGTVETALGSANLILNADTNITVTTGITWTSANTLTLNTNTSGSTIDINAPISGVNGTLEINAASPTDQITTGSGGSVNVKAFVLQSGYWNQNSATLPGFTASNNFEIQGSSTFLRVTGGSGTSTPYQIADIYGLEGLGSPSHSLLASSAILVNNIDANGTANWNGGAGWAPIGFYDGTDSSDSNTYRGTFNGQGYTISGLTLDRTSTSSVAGTGLFGDTSSSATVENVNLTNLDIVGYYYAGGLAGVSNATVMNCTTAGIVNGRSYVGSLLGINGGAVSDSSSSGTVTGIASSSSVGGLIGYTQFGSVNGCSSSATVVTASGSYGVGGLVGVNDVTISKSFATGEVQGTAGLGGLVGLNNGTIGSSYSVGTVHGSGAAIGGLIGDNASGTVTDSYTTSPLILGQGATEAGGLVGADASGTYVNAFWDTGTAGVTRGVGTDSTNSTAGVFGATTANLMSQSYILTTSTSSPVWDFANTWTTNGGTTTPELIGVGSGGNGGSGGGGGGGNSGGGGTTATASPADGSGSNLVPPAIVPQNIVPGSILGGAVTPSFSFADGNPALQTGGAGDLANTSGNDGQIGAGDAAQLGGGGLNNLQSPAASGALNLALSPAVFNLLNQAVTSLGDWTDTSYAPTDDGQQGAGDNGETLLSGGDVVEIGGNTVKSIPLRQAPVPLQQALGNGVLDGMPKH